MPLHYLLMVETGNEKQKSYLNISGVNINSISDSMSKEDTKAHTKLKMKYKERIQSTDIPSICKVYYGLHIECNNCHETVTMAVIMTLILRI